MGLFFKIIELTVLSLIGFIIISCDSSNPSSREDSEVERVSRPVFYAEVAPEDKHYDTELDSLVDSTSICVSGIVFSNPVAEVEEIEINGKENVFIENTIKGEIEGYSYFAGLIFSKNLNGEISVGIYTDDGSYTYGSAYIIAQKDTIISPEDGATLNENDNLILVRSTMHDSASYSLSCSYGAKTFMSYSDTLVISSDTLTKYELEGNLTIEIKSNFENKTFDEVGDTGNMSGDGSGFLVADTDMSKGPDRTDASLR